MDGSGFKIEMEALPRRCISRDRASGRPVMLQLGVTGSLPFNGDRSPEFYNRALGLSYEQVEAMEYGAALGFDVELARPSYVRQVRLSLGQPVGLIKEIAAPPPAPAVVAAPPPPVAAKPFEPPPEVGNFLPGFTPPVLARGLRSS